MIFFCFQELLKYQQLQRQGFMGGQIPRPEQLNENNVRQGNEHNQQQRQLFNNLNVEEQKFNHKVILLQLQRYLQEQRQISRCQKRNQLVENFVRKCKQRLTVDRQQIIEVNLLKEQLKRQLIEHEERCFFCTGRYWEFQQWQISSQLIQSQQTLTFHRLKSFIEDQQTSQKLQLVIYKYIEKGDAFQKNDKIRTMQIYKKPLSEHQLTDLIFHHQFLIVQCEKSYWSFQKNMKKLIIQNSRLLSDVRDKLQGEPRLTNDGFKWFGLKDKWHPSILLQSNTFVIDNIADLRTIASRRQQVRLNYHLLEANCKIYANYIMQSSLSVQKWKQISNFYSIFNFN